MDAGPPPLTPGLEDTIPTLVRDTGSGFVCEFGRGGLPPRVQVPGADTPDFALER